MTTMRDLMVLEQKRGLFGGGRRSGRGLMPKGGSARMAARVRGIEAADAHSRAPGKFSAGNQRRRARNRRLYSYLMRRPGARQSERALLGY